MNGQAHTDAPRGGCPADAAGRDSDGSCATRAPFLPLGVQQGRQFHDDPPA